MKHPFDSLSKIQKVDVPPFLYTRILNRIENKVKETIPVKWAVVAAACLLLVIMLNISVVQLDKKGNTNTDLSEAFSLQTNNSLYNE
jgi:hypothetical protein